MDEPLVTLATFGTIAEAELARNLLSEEGLVTFLADAEAVGMLWHVGGALGGIKLQVAAVDEPRARSILRQRRRWPEEPSKDDHGSDEGHTMSIVRARPYDAPDEDDDELPESRADITARRAWRSAVIGLLLLPPILHFYSAGLLLQLLRIDDPLSNRGKWSVVGAVVIDFVVAMVVWNVFVKGWI